jgi:hypothetical protein
MWIEHPKEFMPLAEPTYEIITDKAIRQAITAWLKSAGFEKWTSYIPMQSNSNEVIIQITKFGWKEVSNTWVINLQKWIDFIQKNGNTTVTQEWINKMRDNYTAIKSMIQRKRIITSSTHTELETITA